ncbi:hypothetical protein AYI68_g3893 [Smittium mucronatum]|uniref:Uncharacterized protein n=1 Tax=Smittium mucronatum TaxID=133383 RepID=A0A1R0GYN3_9FUNG|nr:hypothetical protein AYI68_g3893 [Smittium mucronatum]
MSFPMYPSLFTPNLEIASSSEKSRSPIPLPSVNNLLYARLPFPFWFRFLLSIIKQQTFDNIFPVPVNTQLKPALENSAIYENVCIVPAATSPKHPAFPSELPLSPNPEIFLGSFRLNTLFPRPKRLL